MAVNGVNPDQDVNSGHISQPSDINMTVNGVNLDQDVNSGHFSQPSDINMTVNGVNPDQDVNSGRFSQKSDLNMTASGANPGHPSPDSDALLTVTGVNHDQDVNSGLVSQKSNLICRNNSGLKFPGVDIDNSQLGPEKVMTADEGSDRSLAPTSLKSGLEFKSSPANDKVVTPTSTPLQKFFLGSNVLEKMLQRMKRLLKIAQQIVPGQFQRNQVFLLWQITQNFQYQPFYHSAASVLGNLLMLCAIGCQDQL